MATHVRRQPRGPPVAYLSAGVLEQRVHATETETGREPEKRDRERERERTKRERNAAKGFPGGKRREDRNVVTRGGKRDSGQRMGLLRVAGGDDLEAIGDGVRSTDGWVVVGWRRRVEEGGCRQDQRAVLVRAFEGRWRSGIEGGWRGRQGGWGIAGERG